MTPKERMLIAMQNGKPDHVPCAPDISTMIPMRLLGKPFWETEMEWNPPLWKAYVEAIKYFGIDGWFTYGDLSLRCDDKNKYEQKVVSRDNERIVTAYKCETPAGVLTSETTFFVADSASPTEKPIKDIKQDFDKLRYLYPDILDSDTTRLEEMRAELGDLGALGVPISYPGFQIWFTLVQSGLEGLTYAYMDHPDLIEEWRVMEEKRSLRMMELALDAKPDFILLAGSGSITLQSPTIFRELCVPTIKKMTAMAKQAGIPTMIHSCGKERVLIEILAEESDLNCVNPLEIPPMGDCELAEIKRDFGHRFALMGNIHTTDVMLNGSVEDVERVARKCIDDAAEGGGFILSTGDQCGRDTPDENIFKLVEVCKSYGRYD
ncbi:MAG: uroporphyrinogen decarboxylase family protein [Armatimonadota bacterium]